MNTLAAILFSLLLSWNWGGTSPQFPVKDGSATSQQFFAKIHLLQENKTLEIKGTFYNGSENDINIDYKLTVIKSGQSNSSSDQSGSFKINSKEQVVLSAVTVNLNKKDFYKIKLKVFKNDQLITEDSTIFYGDE